MALGRSIRIYLQSGEVSGIRHAELVNFTGQALFCPRTRLAELAEWTSVVNRQGIYFLFGPEEQQGRLKAYIGESEDVLGRLKQQSKQDFWQECIVFTSKDEHLTKGHVKYLEFRLIERARTAGRYALENGNSGGKPELPRADVAAMDEFLENMPLLLGVLGHRVLDPVTADLAKPGPSQGGKPASRVYRYAVKEAAATGAPADEGFIVFAGSTALPGTTTSMAPGWIALKEELLATKKLTSEGPLLRFTTDVLFNSPSAAAAIVYGNNANGRLLWRAEDGRPLKQVEADELKGAAD